MHSEINSADADEGAPANRNGPSPVYWVLVSVHGIEQH